MRARLLPAPSAGCGSDVSSGKDVQICSKGRFSASKAETEPQDSANRVVALHGCRTLCCRYGHHRPVPPPPAARGEPSSQAGPLGIRTTGPDVAAPPLIGDLLLPRGLRSPPDDWGTTSVVWRRSTFRAGNAVPDSADHAPAGYSTTLRTCCPRAVRTGTAPRLGAPRASSTGTRFLAP